MKYYCFVFFGLLFGSCIDPAGMGEKITALPEFKIKNGIKIKEQGLKVQQAFLTFDDSTMVPESNETNVNKQINCRVLIGSGWKEKNGKVYPGVSNMIETSDGDTLVYNPDLLKSMDSLGISLNEIDYINITATIDKLGKQYDHFIMTFKVWDKTSNAFAEGSFKFKVK